MGTSAPTAILSTDSATSLLEYLQITTGGRRTPGGVTDGRGNSQRRQPPPGRLTAPVAMETSAPTAILSTNGATPLLEYLQITTGGRRPPGGVAMVAVIASVGGLRRGA
ncbi:hypothetical protein [Halomonas sp. DQ26W]|uniref:hypothetical protein n=1 Tax=Halomonas sp. DQ26W TaxID=2282311 RepID=UPI0011C0321B|nr:hypothetical protein [Halomonas sp. DQ26W]